MHQFTKITYFYALDISKSQPGIFLPPDQLRGHRQTYRLGFPESLGRRAVRKSPQQIRPKNNRPEVSPPSLFQNNPKLQEPHQLTSEPSQIL